VEDQPIKPYQKSFPCHKNRYGAICPSCSYSMYLPKFYQGGYICGSCYSTIKKTERQQKHQERKQEREAERRRIEASRQSALQRKMEKEQESARYREERENRREANRIARQRYREMSATERLRVSEITAAKKLEELQSKPINQPKPEPTLLETWARKWAVQSKIKRRNEKTPIPSGSKPITPEYLMELWEKQKGTCALSGRPMSLVRPEGEGTFQSSLVSVDRIDSMVGYCQENIQLVCLAANVMKANTGLTDFKEWCRSIAKSGE